ncbi:hyaluronan mediated motility receptor [Salminus brasiliensis]|uniref:hyaluronan mediated motility receptor n=1 Tax=Salminus brasiliensis TaxID=930266 RepID=UPI003B8337A2
MKGVDVKGAASFHKAERFKAPSKATDLPPPLSKDALMSPVRRTVSVDGLDSGSSSKKDKSSFQAEMKHQKLLEKEIRSLIQQRGEQDRRLLAMEEELKKLEAKLLAAVREKTGLAASVASLERQLVELKKTNEFLKSKVSADTTKKRINSLSMELMEARNKLDAKDKELSFLKISSEGKVKVLETDLEASRATLNALQERNKDLEDLHEETKAQNEEIEKGMDKLHAVIQELREEIKALQGYLDAANEEILDLKGKLQDKSAMERRVSDSQDKLGEVEHHLEKRTAELRDSQNTLMEKEQELQKCQHELQETQSTLSERERELKRHESEMEASKSALRELEEKIQQGAQELQDSQGTVKQQEQELTRIREVLRRTEEELDQRVALMGERCLTLEDERVRTQEEGLRRVQELLADINSLEESRKTEKEAHDELKLRLSALEEQLEHEKARSDSLSSELARERSATETERKQLEEELEEVLEELSTLEQQERLHEEAVQCLTGEKHTLAEDLIGARTELERRNLEVKALKEAHEKAMKKLQEEHSSSLGKIGEMATELEGTRQALSVQKEQAEARAQQLEEEMRTVGQQLQEEQQQILHLKHTQDKEREEYARMLLEVQTKLAQSEKELKHVVEAHSTELRRLQEETEQERQEKTQVLAQLEQARQRRRESAEGRVQEAQVLKDKMEALQQDVAEQRRLLKQKDAYLQSLTKEWQQEKEQLSLQMEREQLCFTEQLAEAQQSTSTEEMEHWKSLYEKLYAKVKPFQEQLDGFAAERDALLNEKGATQAELSKLAGAYANLLGHQNQRQKIKHMVKLKEENLELKQEVAKLRSQIGKQKRELEQMKSNQAPRKFDPSKAFKHELKENQQPMSGLR